MVFIYNSMIYKYLSSSLLRRSIQSDIVISSSWYDGGGVDFKKLKVRAYICTKH